MNLEKTDSVFLTENDERAEVALERYLEERKNRRNDASISYRYFVLDGEAEELTIIEDVRIGDDSIYNLGLYSGEIKIERNVGYETAEELLKDH